MSSNTIDVDPVKLMRWLNARKMTLAKLSEAVSLEPDQLSSDLGQDVVRWSGELAGRVSDVLDIELEHLAVDALLPLAVHRPAASSEAERRTVRRDGIDFYVYYSLAAPRGHVAPVILDILCPSDRLPQLNQGHLEPAITVNLGPGDINGRWGPDLSPDTWSPLRANAGRDRWITGDSYVEPAFCPHTYSLAGAQPARILSYTGASTLADLVDRTNTWPDQSFTALLEIAGERLEPSAVLLQAMSRRAFDSRTLAAAAGVDPEVVDRVLDGEDDAVDLEGLRRLSAVLHFDYRLLLPTQEHRDRVGKTSSTIEASRASSRPFAGYVVADMAGSAATPDLLGQFLLVERLDAQPVLDLQDVPATFYLVTDGSATVSWLGREGETCQQHLGPWDSLWIGPGVRHGFGGAASMLRMGDASTYSSADTFELMNSYRPHWTLGRARRDRQSWGYDR